MFGGLCRQLHSQSCQPFLPGAFVLLVIRARVELTRIVIVRTDTRRRWARLRCAVWELGGDRFSPLRPYHTLPGLAVLDMAVSVGAGTS